MGNLNLIQFINLQNQKLYETAAIEAEEHLVSELHMHKILYILYGGFYAKFKKELFSANFEAWKLGPVEIDYRQAYKSGQNIEVLNKFEIDVSSEELKFLEQVARKTLCFSPWSLVEFTHNSDAWYDNYKSTSHNPIPVNEIKKSFENSRFS